MDTFITVQMLNSLADDESMPTVRCSTCLDWHHRHCAGYIDLNSDNYVCGRCKVSSCFSFYF